MPQVVAIPESGVWGLGLVIAPGALLLYYYYYFPFFVLPSVYHLVCHFVYIALYKKPARGAQFALLFFFGVEMLRCSIPPKGGYVRCLVLTETEIQTQACLHQTQSIIRSLIIPGQVYI